MHTTHLSVSPLKDNGPRGKADYLIMMCRLKADYLITDVDSKFIDDET